MRSKLRLPVFIITALILSTALVLGGCAAEYQVRVEASPLEGGQVEGDGVYQGDEKVTLNAKADEGYSFAGWEENGEIVSTTEIYEFEATDDRNLRAVFEEKEEETAEDKEYEYDESLPEEIKEWINYSREIMLNQSREYEDTLYLLSTFGEKDTGGYEVEISEVNENQDTIEVEVKYTEPGEDEEKTDEITSPYDLEIVEDVDTPINVIFEATGDREHAPELHGIDWLRPIVAGEEDIRILGPSPDATVSSDFVIEGIEHVFEGTVVYELYDEDENKVESNLADGGHGFDWGHFTIEPAVGEEIDSGETFMVEVFSESPKDGERENMVELEYTLE